MDDFNRELLARLPLAESVFVLLGHVLDSRALDRLFEEHRGRCYERELSFASLVGLIRDALVLYKGSGRASFERARQEQRLNVAVQSAYGKLARMPLAVSQALLSHAAQRLAPVMCPERLAVLPPSLSAMKVVVLDGKTIKHVARRLKLMRRLDARLLGGQLAVALDLSSGLALGMTASTNGEANEVPLSRELIGQLRPQLTGPVLWMADRQYCDLGLPALFTQDHGHFLIRYSHNVGFHPDASRPQQELQSPQGQRVLQEWGWLGGPKDKRRRYLRRVTLFREGDEPVILITDLLDEKLFPATELLDLYLMRWGIERLFQQVTEVFSLRQLIGSTPKATVFQASFCFVLYNLIQVIKGYAAQAGERKIEEVSGEKLFTDVTRELTGWSVAGVKDVAELQVSRTPRQVSNRLQELLG
jgi:IS4 transposase